MPMVLNTKRGRVMGTLQNYARPTSVRTLKGMGDLDVGSIMGNLVGGLLSAGVKVGTEYWNHELEKKMSEFTFDQQLELLEKKYDFEREMKEMAAQYGQGAAATTAAAQGTLLPNPMGSGGSGGAGGGSGGGGGSGAPSSTLIPGITDTAVLLGVVGVGVVGTLGYLVLRKKK